jgi:hypothetical protein
MKKENDKHESIELVKYNIYFFSHSKKIFKLLIIYLTIVSLSLFSIIPS